MFHTIHLATSVANPAGDSATTTPSPAVIDRIASAASANPAAAIGAVVAVMLLLAVAAGVAAVWLGIRNRKRARIAAMSPAERERYDAVVEYRARIASAEKGLANATKERTSRLKASEKALAQARGEASRTVASYRGQDGGVAFTSTQIAVPQGTFPLTASVFATVDTAGNLATSSRSTLTRIAAGGLLFGPVGAIIGGVAKKTRVHDVRELYLLIQGDTFATLITCNADDGPRVRQFAMAIRQAALNADAARAHHAQAITSAEQALAWEQQNVAPVDAARRELEAAATDTARLDAATAAVAREEAQRAADAAQAQRAAETDGADRTTDSDQARRTADQGEAEALS
ncbi:hypothetical protein ACX9R5_18690 [Rathayibacter sp. CAU 1779]